MRRTTLALEEFESRLQPSVNYYGGYVLPHVETQAVYLGSDWQSSQGLAMARSIDQFDKYVVNSPFMDAMTRAGYGVGRGSATTGVLDGVSIDKSYFLTDSTIRQDLQAAIQAGIAQPDANRLYVVYVEPGVAIMNDHDYNAQKGRYNTSIADFLGYHTSFVGQDASGNTVNVRYAVIAYPGGYNPTPASLGLPSTLAQETVVTSHELAEAVTDPDPANPSYRPAWFDPQNGEIGDITVGHFQWVNGYVVQQVSDRYDRAMVI